VLRQLNGLLQIITSSAMEPVSARYRWQCLSCVKAQSSCLVPNYLAAMLKGLSHVCTHALFTYWYNSCLLLLLLLLCLLMLYPQTIRSALSQLPLLFFFFFS